MVKREVLEELVAAFPDTWISDPVQGAVPCVFCVLGDEVPNKPHVSGCCAPADRRPSPPA